MITNLSNRTVLCRVRKIYPMCLCRGLYYVRLDFVQKKNSKHKERYAIEWKVTKRTNQIIFEDQNIDEAESKKIKIGKYQVLLFFCLGEKVLLRSVFKWYNDRQTNFVTYLIPSQVGWWIGVVGTSNNHKLIFLEIMSKTWMTVFASIQIVQSNIMFRITDVELTGK